MYIITIKPEDPCNEDDKMQARGISLLAVIANLLSKLHDETPEFDGLLELMGCLNEIVMKMNDDDVDLATSNNIDMDSAYSFTVVCEKN